MLDALTRIGRALPNRDPDDYVKLNLQYSFETGTDTATVPVGIVPMGWRWILDNATIHLLNNQTLNNAEIAVNGRPVWETSFVLLEGNNNTIIEPGDIDVMSGGVITLNLYAIATLHATYQVDFYVQFSAYRV